ncbi:lambda exonuclease family protein [Porticoccus sp.]
MLDFHDIEQNTDDWLDMRAGRLTSSNMAKVMANYGKAFGDPAKRLASEIALGRITGKAPSNGYSNEHMERGNEQEPLARMKYQEFNFVDVTNGGFFCDDFLGCSPDGRVGKNTIEIKSVIASVHTEYVAGQKIPSAYKWQCISNVIFTGADWLDFVSYCADFPPDKQLFIYRLYRESIEAEAKQMMERIEQFRELVDKQVDVIMNSPYTVYNSVSEKAA